MKFKYAQLKSDDERHEEEYIVPYKTDYLFRLMIFLTKKNPVIIAISYFSISFGGIYIIGLLTGQYYGGNGIPPMYMQIVDNINLGFLAPVGAGVLCYLYKSISSTFLYLKTDGVIPKEEIESYDKFMLDLEIKYNNMAVVVGAAVISLSLNTYDHFYRTKSWLGINGGVTALYGRLFVVFNIFMILLILYKCILTVWAMQKILNNYNLVIQPMHPDNAGGLKPLGNLSIAINYFVALIIIFSSLMVIFIPVVRQQPVYLVLFIVFYLSSPFLLFGSLSKANKKMAKIKKEAKIRLGITFDHYYEKLVKGKKTEIYNIDSADEISKIYNLYEIVEKMPVWPFDTKSLVRLFTTITIPLLIFLVEMISNTDSIIYNLDKMFKFIK